MEEFTVLASRLSDALACNDVPQACDLLSIMQALLAAQPEEACDAFYDSWAALQRACAASPAAHNLVLQLAESAAAAGNPRELFSLFSESLSECMSTGATAGIGARTQLHLVRLLASLLLRIRRKWGAFLSDYLRLLLRWSEVALPHLALEGGGEPASGLDSPGVPTLPDAAAVVAGSLSSLAAFTQQQQQQQGQQQQEAALLQATRSPFPAAAPLVLQPAERAAASSVLLQAACQLASLAVQLPQCQAAAQVQLAMALSAPAALGRKLEGMGALAATALQLPARLLHSVLPLLQLPVGVAELAQAAAALQRQEEARAEAALQGGPGAEDSEEEEGEEGSWLSAAEVHCGAALGLCVAILSVEATADNSSSGCPSSGGEPPLPGSQLPPLPVPGGEAAAAQLSLLAPAVRSLLDLGARHQSVALTLLPLHCLAAACHRCQMAEGSSISISNSSSSQKLKAGGSREQDVKAAEVEGARSLVEALVMLMSFNPVELVRSCAHEALHAVLDSLQPQARLDLLLQMLKMPSSAAAVVGLQRLRQEMAAAWGQNWSPFLSPSVLAAACKCFQAGGGPGMGWQEDGDLLASADVMAAALSLFRFVLLRQQAAALQAAALQAAALQAAALQAAALQAGQQDSATGEGVVHLVTQQSVERTLQRDLLPLQAAVVRLLQLQARSMDVGSGSGSASSAAGDVGQGPDPELESWLALQRLLDVLERVIEVSQKLPQAA